MAEASEEGLGSKWAVVPMIVVVVVVVIVVVVVVGNVFLFPLLSLSGRTFESWDRIPERLINYVR